MNKEQMKDFFFNNLPTVLYMSHYDLAKLDPDNNPSNNPNDWKLFCAEEDISQFIESEIEVLKQVELKKILQNISKTGSNVGTGQTLNALMKSMEGSRVKDGPIYIYSYVPPTPEEANNKNVRILEGDIFNAETKELPDK